ncbi:hypothetical protein EPN18_07875 [bacterium]|nr:MAG: hypothetical protein EPN18_07875 [bacterium]
MNNKLEEIMRRIEGGATVVTVNARLSRSLCFAFDDMMKTAGRGAWPSPDILPLDAWKERIWNESSPDTPLLSSVRAKALWERTVERDPLIKSGELLLEKGTASLSFEAYMLLKEYRLTIPDYDLYLTEEAKALKRWAAIYEEEVKRLGFANRAMLSTLAGARLKGVKALSEVVFAGFDELSPATRLLIDAVVKSGLKASYWPREPGTDVCGKPLSFDHARVSLTRFDSENDEITYAAKWARSVIKPGVSVAVIVPELGTYADIISREFRAELAPASVLPDYDGPDAFNISLGRALSEEPLVRSALDALSIGTGKDGRNELDDLSLVLLSPYFSSLAHERLECARFDARLKDAGFLTISIAEAVRYVGSDAGAAFLVKKFNAWALALKDARGKKLASQWALHSSALLKNIGWLGNVKLTSVEYQALKAWNRLFEEFSSLDDLLGPLTFGEAFKKLTSLATDAIHQAETPRRQIQVLGLLESTGLYFDRIRLICCHEDVLPGEPRPNPFIPLDIQKAAKLPNSSHARELEFARKVVKRLVASCKTLDVSFPAMVDRKQTGASAIFSSLEVKKPIDGQYASNTLKSAVSKANGFETMPVEDDVPVSSAELAAIRGGTLIIKDQSLCPFKAFATHRLVAKEVTGAELGLSAADRGRVVHRALKLFWEKAKGSAELRRMFAKGELDGFIKEIATEAFKGVRIAWPLSVRFAELEKERLISVLKEWTHEELGRGEFTVKAVEKTVSVNIGGLAIEGRIDRIDEVEDKREVILDYKTGEAKREDWLGQRPREPQLIIYSRTGRYDCVSFARLIPGDCKFVGISNSADILPGVKPLEADKFREKSGPEPPSWDGLMANWKVTVETLANDFLAGRAGVNPLEPKTCLYCGLAPLCRINDIGLIADIDDEE